MTPEELYIQLGGVITDAFPALHSPVHHTARMTPYLQHPGVVLLSRPRVYLGGMTDFLAGYGEDSHFAEYLDDPVHLPSGAQLCKVAGQLCYMSFGEKRTKNADARKYFDNILSSAHGSVLEHANYTLLFYGISRSVTHELVRHRAGMAFSQLSQRYVSGKMLRFVERPEFASDSELHAFFMARIDETASTYASLSDGLLRRQKQGIQILSAEQRTDLRKKVQQVARSVLPNETEAPIVVTGNVRAWRHVVEMRASAHAETEIRELAVRAFLCLHQVEPVLFGDYTLEVLGDGTYAVKTPYEKV